MKITLIGAAGVRTPLLIHGLAGASVRLEELAFWDTDAERLKTIGRVAEAMGKRSGLRARVRTFSDPQHALDGADYVITSIRVGGIDARIKDETIALAHGLVGQETVGAGGFACAMRNLAAMLEYAHLIERICPNATVINFTNPVGIISQGLLNYSGVNLLGVCDTPLETFEALNFCPKFCLLRRSSRNVIDMGFSPRNSSNNSGCFRRSISTSITFRKRRLRIRNRAGNRAAKRLLG